MQASPECQDRCRMISIDLKPEYARTLSRSEYYGARHTARAMARYLKPVFDEDLYTDMMLHGACMQRVTYDGEIRHTRIPPEEWPKI